MTSDGLRFVSADLMIIWRSLIRDMLWFQVASIDDKNDYRMVNDAIKAIGFGANAETFWKIVAAVLHLVGESSRRSIKWP